MPDDALGARISTKEGRLGTVISVQMDIIQIMWDCKTKTERAEIETVSVEECVNRGLTKVIILLNKHSLIKGNITPASNLYRGIGKKKNPF